MEHNRFTFGRRRTDAREKRTGEGEQTFSREKQSAAALSLLQEILHGLEQFVLSTPDLDAPRFLQRLRRTAAELHVQVPPHVIDDHRRWAEEALATFGQLQRRYLAEREEELWRLIQLYQNHQKVEGAANVQFHDALRAAHSRMGEAVRLDDLRQVREHLERELERANAIVDEKERADQARSALLEAQVRQLEAALAAARLEASRDSLTGVYHRGGFERELEALLSSSTQCALALVDVDNFKGINDTLGHLVGDHILQLAVSVLVKATRPGDIIGRYGGDEFCIVVPGTTPERLADRLDTHAQPRNIQFHFDDRLCSVRFSMSIGVAASIPGDTPASLMKRADEALYQAKHSGKGHARVAATPARAAC